MKLVPPPDTAPWLNLRVRNGPIIEVQLLVGAETDVLDDNVDAQFVLRDGTVRLATLVTLQNVTTLMQRWRNTGECGGGKYLYVPDMIVVPSLAAEDIVAAAEALGEESLFEVLPSSNGAGI